MMGKLKEVITLEEEINEAVPEIVFEDVQLNMMSWLMKYFIAPYIPFFFYAAIGYSLFSYFLGEFVGAIMFALIMAVYLGMWLVLILFAQYSAQAEASKYYTMITHIWINDRSYLGLIQVGNGGIREIGKRALSNGDVYYEYVVIPRNTIKFFDRNIGKHVRIDALVILTPDKWSRTFYVQPAQAIFYKNFQVEVPAAHGDLEFRGVRFSGDKRAMYFQVAQSSWYSVRRSEKLGLVNVEPVHLKQIEELYVNEELLHMKMAYADLVSILEGKFKADEDISQITDRAVGSAIEKIKEMEQIAQSGAIDWKRILTYLGFGFVVALSLYVILWSFGLI